MASVDRNQPKRAESSQSRYSLMKFLREFPDDAACLDWLWRERYAADGHHTHCPKCDRVRKFHKVKDRPAWDCDTCGYHLHPLAGTIFHKSSTSLHLWFYAMFLISQTRCGISAKQLERELGVTYKTAWRMFNLIRNQLMSSADDEPLSGDVEVDETFVGGKPRAYESRTMGRARVRRTWKKETVLGMAERGGRVRIVHLPDRGGPGIKRQITTHVLPESMIFTDASGRRIRASTRPTSAIVAFATRLASTSMATRTRRRSKASSDSRRTASVASTTPCRPSGCKSREPMFTQLLERAAAGLHALFGFFRRPVRAFGGATTFRKSARTASRLRTGIS